MKPRLSFIAMLVALAGISYAAQSESLTATITKVDPGTKCFTVKAKEGEVVIKYDDKTQFDNIKPADASVLAEGCPVKVNGKFSSDNKVITATSIERLPDGQKTWNAVKPKESHCAGTFHKKDRVLTVTAGDKTITIKPGKGMRYGNRAAGTAADLKQGRSVWMFVVPVGSGNERLAQRVVITTPAEPAQQPSATTAPAPTTTNEKQPEGTVSGVVTAVGLQDLTVKIAKDNDPNKVFTYNITLLTEIVVNGKPGKLQDIKKGMKSTIVTSDGNNLARITAEGGLPPVKPQSKKTKK
jgi:hypothetical protein